MKTYPAIPVALSLIGAIGLTCAVMLVSLAAPVRGQTRATPVQAQTPAVPTQSKINLTLEQRRNIKELIKDLGVPSAPANVDTAVGATVPASIKLTPMPADVAAKVPQVKSHLFFIQSTKVIIVDPKENKIVDAIE
jgi:hypothetical protein